MNTILKKSRKVKISFKMYIYIYKHSMFILNLHIGVVLPINFLNQTVDEDLYETFLREYLKMNN